MIIDCHGHYTTTPPAHAAFHAAQLAAVAEATRVAPAYPSIASADIRSSIAENQLSIMDQRGIDAMVISPQASIMDHHVTDRATSQRWAQVCNDLVHRATMEFPQRLYGCCQLPQTPDGDLVDAVEELRRCIDELGFVGCNVNPDPSGGSWAAPPMTDRYWYPLYETLVELDVPAMIHVSASCNPNVHTLGAHYLHADTTVFMQLLQGSLFTDFPTLRLIIPHGGGAVPYHWGRFRGLAERLARPALGEHLMDNLMFDTCVYHQAGIDLLVEVIDAKNLLFASEMLGAVRGANPSTGIPYDDTLRYLISAQLSPQDRTLILETNALRIFPRLAAQIAASTLR